MADQHLDGWAAAVLQANERPGWTFVQEHFDPAREHEVESRFALGNGLFGVRAARTLSRGPMWISWLQPQHWASWPRTLVAGLFETPDAEPRIPALVPAPDWLRYRLLLDGEPLFLHSGELLVHRRMLDLERGLLLTQWHERDWAGRLVQVRTLRLVSQADRAIGLQVAQIALDQPAEVTLQAWLELAGPGLEPVRVAPNAAVWRTAGSIRRGKWLAISMAAALLLNGRAHPPAERGQLQRAWRWTAEPNQAATFWRIVSLARGDAQHDPGPSSRAALERARRDGPRGVLQAHAAAWGQRWLASDLEIEGDEVAQRAVRFAVYHLNSAANPEDPHVSISARGLTGEAYLGHVFWDTEIFLLPFYSLTWPEAARALLRYRSHTLAGARAKAARLGYRGALYAWESADTGEEATPEYAYGPDGHLIPIRCGSQEQHISADVAYAVWQYWLATEDVPFLLEAGAEILLETARFWASRATLEDDGQYHLRGVIGPDEYHEQVDDNAFTNVMAAWNLERGLAVADLLRTRWPEHWLALKERLGLAEAELRQWPTVAAGLCVPMDAESGVLEQFAGYFGLDQIDLMQFEPRRVPMDVVLGPERTRTSQVLKQADVVMLLALLPERFAPAIQATNFGYYEPRCGHGSSLSRSVHALVAARVGQMDLAMRYFREAAVIDLEDTTRTGGGGVHMAALGGLWQAVVLGFAGLRLQPEGISLDPVLPPSWESLAFRVQWRGRRLRVHIAGGAPAQVTVRLEHGAPVPIAIGGTLELLEGERTWTATSSNHSVRPRDCVANGTAAGVGSRRPGGDN